MSRDASQAQVQEQGVWTDLEGRLERLNFAVGAGAYTPLFEAIHNALDSIEESRSAKGEVTITIEREHEQLSLSDEIRKQPGIIKNIVITDNGKGFDSENFMSFRTLDSQLKLKRGGKGVGRLFCLKCFEAVEVDSVYEESGERLRRKIRFSAKDGCRDNLPVKVSKNSQIRTIVRLLNYKRIYEAAFRSRKPTTVASEISRHFLPYLLFGKPCTINLVDEDETIAISREGLPAPECNTFRVGGEEFTIHHIRMRSGADAHVVSLCASGRVVKDIKLIDLDIPVGKKSKIKRQDESEFHYVGYVTSSYLDSTVNAERTGFNMEPERIEIEGLEVVSLPEVRERAKELVETFLEEDLVQMRAAKEARIEEVLEHQLSAMKYLKKFNPADLEQIPLDDNKDEIAKKLTILHYQNHVNVAETAKEVVRRVNVEDPASIDFEKELEKFGKVIEVHQADLGQYVLYRAWILDLLLEICSKRQDGKYELEKALHSLIFPMRVDEWRGAELAGNKHNLWLIDERLAMFDYITSDVELSKHKVLEGASEAGRPDLCCYFFGENKAQKPITNVALIELKRPGKEKPYSSQDDGDPVLQVLDYVDTIRAKRMKDKAGRPISVVSSTKFFCYVICETTNDHMKRVAGIHRMKESFDEAGWYDYFEKQNAYVEVISLDKLLSHARMRNKLFFEKLGLPVEGLVNEDVQERRGVSDKDEKSHATAQG
jgi:hypothetical protein